MFLLNVLNLVFIGMLECEIGVDGFLGSLHTVLLMDDAVLVATSQEKCLKNFDIVFSRAGTTE